MQMVTCVSTHTITANTHTASSVTGKLIIESSDAGGKVRRCLRPSIYKEESAGERRTNLVDTSSGHGSAAEFCRAMAAALISAICLWSAYTTNTEPPPDAFPAGFYHIDGDRVTSPLYVVRLNGTGDEEPAVGWQRSRNNVVIHGVRGFNDIHVEGNIPAEILTCKGLEQTTMRWVRYHPWIDMQQCLPLATSKNGEKIYLARIFVKDRQPASAYLPARFVPSSGLAFTAHYGAHATDDFKLFCKIHV